MGVARSSISVEFGLLHWYLFEMQTSARSSYKETLKLWIPPVAYSIRSKMQRLLSSQSRPNGLFFSPEGWVDLSKSGWNDQQLIARKLAAWNAFEKKVSSPGPLGFSHESQDPNDVWNMLCHNLHLSFGYVLAMTARHKDAIEILDWGGGLGQYALVARSLLPGVKIDFHCKEMPSLVDAGKRVNPAVYFTTDESCLDQQYDLVMMSSSLQYTKEWKPLLEKLARSTRKYLYLQRMPIVEGVPTFAAKQIYNGAEMMYWQFNRDEVFGVLQKEGLSLLREFVVNEDYSAQDAPARCHGQAWLLEVAK